MFKAWQIAVALVAAVFMLVSISAGTPFWVSVTSALLAMSVLASDSGTQFAAFSAWRFRQMGDDMKVKVTRGYKGMPEGTNVGDEIEINDADFAEQRRLGNVERAQASDSQQQRNQQQQQDRSPTAVDALSTDRFPGKNQDR